MRFQQWMFKKSNIHFMLHMKSNAHSLEKALTGNKNINTRKNQVDRKRNQVNDHQQPREPETTPVFSTAAPSSVLRSTQSNGVSGESAEYQVQN